MSVRQHASGARVTGWCDSRGPLVGTLAPTPTFLAQADNRLHDILPSLTKDMDPRMPMTDVN